VNTAVATPAIVIGVWTQKKIKKILNHKLLWYNNNVIKATLL
jgi:hypothetical protein